MFAIIVWEFLRCRCPVVVSSLNLKRARILTHNVLASVSRFKDCCADLAFHSCNIVGLKKKIKIDAAEPNILYFSVPRTTLCYAINC